MSIVSYSVDEQNRIVKVGAGWDENLERMGASAVGPTMLVGKNLLDFFCSTEVRNYYNSILDTVRETGEEQVIPSRCDDANYKRYHEDRFRLEEEGLVGFCSRMLCEIPHPEILELLSGGSSGRESFITICSVCKRVQIDGDEWIPLSEAMAVHPALMNGASPVVLQTVCKDCASHTRYRKMLVHVPLAFQEPQKGLCPLVTVLLPDQRFWEVTLRGVGGALFNSCVVHTPFRWQQDGDQSVDVQRQIDYVKQVYPVWESGITMVVVGEAALSELEPLATRRDVSTVVLVNPPNCGSVSNFSFPSAEVLTVVGDTFYSENKSWCKGLKNQSGWRYLKVTDELVSSLPDLLKHSKVSALLNLNGAGLK